MAKAAEDSMASRESLQAREEEAKAKAAEETEKSKVLMKEAKEAMACC